MLSEVLFVYFAYRTFNASTLAVLVVCASYSLRSYVRSDSETKRMCGDLHRYFVFRL